MEIRRMVPDDYNAVRALWLSTPGMGLNDVDDAPEGIARFLVRNPDTCFVALQDKILIGVILAGHDGRRGHIYHMAVVPECRRAGVGRALVDAVLAALTNAGIRKVSLVAFKKNADGNAFWARMNFGVRDDLVYRDRTLAPLRRIDT